MENKNTAMFRYRKIAWLALLLIVVGALAMVLAPVWIIMPFKAQSQIGVESSFVLRQCRRL
jgi:hypothetical protein